MSVHVWRKKEEKEEKKVFLKLEELEETVVLRAVEKDGGDSHCGLLLSIDKATHKVMAYGGINPDLGFELTYPGGRLKLD